MLKTNIVGEHNGGHTAHVSDHNTLFVTQRDAEPPSIGTESRLRYYSSVLGSTGADSGTTNMNVNGAVTAQEFFIEAHPDYDLRVMAIVIIIADQNIAHNAFGGVVALANGWSLSTVESGDVTTLIDEAKTSGQVIAQAGFGHPYGGGATSFQLTKWTGTEDAHTILIPTHSYIPNGIRIGRGTKDKVISTVNDDLTGLTEFTVRLIGYRHYP